MNREQLRRAADMSALQLAFAANSARARQSVVAAEPIAVIGLGCRFPATLRSPASLWAFLREGGDAVGPIPKQRFDVDDYYDPEPGVPGRMYVREGAFLADVAGFDPAFFSISPREADHMDPQQRLLLEVAWEALEHAGQRPSKLARSNTGVWIGAMHYDYADRMARSGAADARVGTGSVASVLAGRLAHTLDLAGPCMTVDTACSSSLVAAHLAVQALRSGACDLALAGGVNLNLSPSPYIVECQMRMLSPSGRCRSFDAGADGFVRGEGCGVLVLARLSDAIARGDRVLAVIRGSAVNHDGASSGLTVPNGASQEALIRQALADALVLPEQVGFIEAHGTGTALGDPIELAALGRVFAGSGDEPVWLSSIKTNFGHTEGAAGVAGLLEAILALAHAELPPSLHFDRPTPHVDWDGLGLRVVDTARPFVGRGGRRIAGVSSFGFSGTNAHLILEAADGLEAQRDPQTAAPRKPIPLGLSGRNPACLAASIDATIQWLDADRPAFELADLSETSLCRRDAQAERLVVLGDSVEELRAALITARASLDDGRSAAKVIRGRRGPRAARIAWVLRGAEPLAGVDLRALIEAGVRPTVIVALDGALARAAELAREPSIAATVVLADGRVADARRLESGPALEPARLRAALAEVDVVLDFAELDPELVPHDCLQVDARSWSSLVSGLAALHCAGLELDWPRLLGGHARLVDLPPQAFDRRHHWFDEADSNTDGRGMGGPTRGPLLGAPRVLPDLPNLDERRFDAHLHAELAAWWTDTNVGGPATLPRFALLGAMASATGDDRPVASLRAIELQRPPALELGASLELHAVQRGASIEVFARVPGDPWRSIARAVTEPSPANHDAPSLAGLRERIGDAIAVDRVLERGTAPGRELGPRLRSLSVAWDLAHQAPSPTHAWLARLRLPDRLAHDDQPIHPCLLEAAAQLLRGADGPELEPRRIASAHWLRPAGRDPWLHVRGDAAQLDLDLFDAEGRLAAVVRGVEFERELLDEGLVELRWRARPPSLSDASLRPPSIRDAIREHARSTSDERERAIATKFEAAAGDWVAAALLALGGDWREGATLDPEAFAARAEVPPKRRRLLARCFEILAEQGLLSAQGSAWTVLRRPEPGLDPGQGLTRLVALEPAAEPERALLQRCAPHLAEVLRGHVDPLELLFPPADSEPGSKAGSNAESKAGGATELYRDSPAVARLNALARAAVERLVAAAGADRKIRVLEVGAGTGATTRELLPMLPSSAEYLLTDISPHFVELGLRELGPVHPGLRGAVFDLERDPGSQGIEPGRFDLIVAANVLHATRDLAGSARSLAQLLAPGGLVLILEVTAKRRWFDLTFGLSDGWWRFDDHDLRPDYPLIDRRAWLDLLERVGFVDAVALADDDGPTSALLAARPREQAGARALLVGPASEAREALVDGLRASGRAIVCADPAALPQLASFDEIIHVGALALELDPEPADMRQAEQLACAELLPLIQALAPLERPPALRVLTRGAVAAPDGPIPGLVGACLRGIIDVASVELPSLRPILIDLDPAAEIDTQIPALVRVLADRERETVIALRDAQAWIPRLVARPNAERRAPWRPRNAGWYLVSGGLRGLGWAVARWLVDHGATRVALLGRRPPSPERELELADLRRRGVELETFAVDVANLDALQSITAELRARAPICGVIHSAGALADASLTNQTRASMAVPFAAKVHGSWALHRATRSDALDLFVMFGSSASLLASPGQANHAAVNGFEDTLAAHRRALGLPGTTIDWGPWAEIGAAVELAPALEQRGLRALGVAEGLELFARLVGEDLTQVGVIPRDARLLRGLATTGAPALLTELIAQQIAAQGDDAHSLAAELRPAEIDELLALPADQGRARLLVFVERWVAAILRWPANEALDPRASLTALGLDSLMAIELRNRLVRELGVEIAVDSLIARACVASLTTELHERLALARLRPLDQHTPSESELEFEEVVL